MYNRRKFLKVSAAASSACAVGGAMGMWAARAQAASEPMTGAKIDFYKVMFDAEQSASVAFGQAARSSGLNAEPVGLDVTSVWYDDLYHRWRTAPAAIAGLTSQQVAFCMQMLGQDVGMRVVYRAEHRPMADGRWQHRISAPNAVLAHASSLDSPAWWRGAMSLIQRCPAQLADRATRTLVSASNGAVAAPQKALVSWIVAPIARA